jgi:DNA-binding LacI/PurR family transcriptional regulator
MPLPSPDVAGRVTLQTIADRLGVSRMTVSNAFSRPEQLSAGLRARILATADELGYAGPDPAGRALARGTSGAVGVLLTDSLHEAFADDIATSFLRAIADELAPTGYALTLLTTSAREDLVPARDLALDGALIYSCRPTSAAKEWLLRRGLPLVFVDHDAETGHATVNVDDRGGARAAAEHLVALGHRRIGIVTKTVVGPTGPADPAGVVEERSGEGHPQRQRMLGWLDALGAAGIAPSAMQVFGGPDERADARIVARQLLDRTARPTAVLCFSDVVAFDVIATAGELGIDVPGELSVVGFDDAQAAAAATPPLTTVRQDVVAKGHAAGQTLIAAITARRDSTPAPSGHSLLRTELVVRDSTAPPTR